MSIKEDLGFDTGSIWLATGDTYRYRKELKDMGAKYNSMLKWHFTFMPSEVLPDGVGLVELPWSAIANEDDTLKPTAVINDLIYDLTVGPGKGWFIGEIGDVYEGELTVEKKIYLPDGPYGASYLYTFYSNDDNIFVWRTAKSLILGETYYIKGTIKGHQEYRNDMQNILTKCEIKEVLWF